MNKKIGFGLVILFTISLLIVGTLAIVVMPSIEVGEGDPDCLGGGFRLSFKNPEIHNPPGDPDCLGGGFRNSA